MDYYGAVRYVVHRTLLNEVYDNFNSHHLICKAMQALEEYGLKDGVESISVEPTGVPFEVHININFNEHPIIEQDFPEFDF